MKQISETMTNTNQNAVSIETLEKKNEESDNPMPRWKIVRTITMAQHSGEFVHHGQVKPLTFEGN